MGYMARHGMARARPVELVPGTLSVITVRMDYLPRDTARDCQALELTRLEHPQEAVVSVCARGRDYYKVLRSRLQKLADRIGEAVGLLCHRVFADSAPVLEAELASRSGQGWRGKHTLGRTGRTGRTGVSLQLICCGRLRNARRQLNQGLVSTTPVCAKSATLRVTTVNLCSMAVAAIMASRADCGFGVCNAAHTGAVVSVKGKMRPENLACTPVSQARSTLPCGGVRRSTA
jgi:hypothetical protein